MTLCLFSVDCSLPKTKVAVQAQLCVSSHQVSLYADLVTANSLIQKNIENLNKAWRYEGHARLIEGERT